MGFGRGATHPFFAKRAVPAINHEQFDNADGLIEREFPLPDLVAKSKAVARLVTQGILRLRQRGSRLLWRLSVWRWSTERAAGGLRIDVQPFAPITPAVRRGVTTEARHVSRFLGAPVTAVLPRPGGTLARRTG